MNASSWRKAADLIAQGTQATQQIQAVATSDSSQLESLPLISLAADESGPPQVNYGSEQPLAASTPRTITRSRSRGPKGPGPPLTTKNEAPAPKFYKIEAPEWQF